MFRFYKYAVMTMAAFIVSILFIDRLPQVLAIISLAAAAVYFIARKVDNDLKNTMISLFLVAFMLQVFLSLILYDKTIDTKYYGFSYKGDDYVYGDFGTIVGDLWRRGIFLSLKALKYYNLIGPRTELQKYQLYSAFIFCLFGACAGQVLLIINSFLHAITIIPVYFICRALNIRDRVILFALFLFLFWPSTFYWSLFNFREPMMLFCSFTIFALATKFDSGPHLRTVLILVPLFFIAYFLKEYFIIFIPFVIIYLIGLWQWRYKGIFILSLLLLFILRQLLAEPLLSNLYKDLPILNNSLFGIRYTQRFSNTQYLTNLFTPTIPRALLYFPFGFLATVFLPFLLRPFSLSQVMANIETILWWGLMPFLIGGVWISFRREFKKTFIILVAFFCWLSILAFTQGNMGTLIRQKAVIYYTGFIFIALGIDRAFNTIEKEDG